MRAWVTLVHLLNPQHSQPSPTIFQQSIHGAWRRMYIPPHHIASWAHSRRTGGDGDRVVGMSILTAGDRRRPADGSLHPGLRASAPASCGGPEVGQRSVQPLCCVRPGTRLKVKATRNQPLLLLSPVRGGTTVPIPADYRRRLSSRPAALYLRGPLLVRVRATGCRGTPASRAPCTASGRARTASDFRDRGRPFRAARSVAPHRGRPCHEAPCP